MHLTKLELQEMLREMGVKFSHTESYENLKKLFQAENHMRWMGKVKRNGQRSGSGLKRIIRKKASSGTPKMVMVSKPTFSSSDGMSHVGGGRKAAKQTHSRERIKRKPPVHTKSEFSESHAPSPQKPAEKSDLSKDVFATVLRRAQNCCEFCGQECSFDQNASDGPKPFHIQPLALGGEVSVKNVVALCPTCYHRLSADAQPSDLKQLKRKARGKIIRTVHIQRKSRA